jgi:hypothetical protein
MEENNGKDGKRKRERDPTCYSEMRPKASEEERDRWYILGFNCHMKSKMGCEFEEKNGMAQKIERV